jgi:hypothetical protein
VAPAWRHLYAGPGLLAAKTGVSLAAGSQPGLDRVPLDIDLHQIPADPAKGEPAHRHADFRSLDGEHARGPGRRSRSPLKIGPAWRQVQATFFGYLRRRAGTPRPQPRRVQIPGVLVYRVDKQRAAC